MAMTFNSEGVRKARESLMKSSNNLKNILEDNLDEALTESKQNYQSDTATELYAFYDRMKNNFPGFYSAISQCANYLETVAGEYEKVENGASELIGKK